MDMDNEELEPRYYRRLSDLITVAFYKACEVGSLDAAAHLADALELEVTRSIRLRKDGRDDGDDRIAVRTRLQMELRKASSSADTAKSDMLT